MKFLHLLSAALSVFTFNGAAFAAKSFAGSNLYYAAGLSSDERHTLFGAMQNAGMKVLRVWTDAQGNNVKGTSITSIPALETTIGNYDDTVLEMLDDVMVDAHNYGIKLLISMHSWNALSAGDVYGKTYGTGDFYAQDTPQQQFDARLKHVLNHKHKSLGQEWKTLKDYIFAFEAENEAMIGNGQSYIQSHTDWQCNRAKTIKGELGDNSGILVTTGGESWMDESVQSAWLNCDSLDVIAIHGYGTGDFSTDSIKKYVDEAQKANKKLLYQEWGACYYTTSNNNCASGSVLDTNTRNNNIKTWANQISAAGVPWMYWQVLPNADPHYDTDFEIGVGDDSWSTLEAAAQAASQADAAFDFSDYLL